MICKHKIDHTEPRHICDGCCDMKSILYQINSQFEGIRAKPKVKKKQKRVREGREDVY